MCNYMGLYSVERIEAEVAFLSSEEFFIDNLEGENGEDPFMEDFYTDDYTEDERDVF